MYHVRSSFHRTVGTDERAYPRTLGPYSIMAMLMVYCLRNVSLTGSSHGIPEAIAILLVVILHKWKHNTLLSIVSGTLCYMFLIQVILVKKNFSF